MTSLTSLLLSRTQLQGSVPDLGLLTNLRALWLDNNGLVGALPSSLSSLTALTDLMLQGNKGLSGAIPDLSKLTNLQRVSLTVQDAAAAPSQCPAGNFSSTSTP